MSMHIAYQYHRRIETDKKKFPHLALVKTEKCTQKPSFGCFLPTATIFFISKFKFNLIGLHGLIILLFLCTDRQLYMVNLHIFLLVVFFSVQLWAKNVSCNNYLPHGDGR